LVLIGKAEQAHQAPVEVVGEGTVNLNGRSDGRVVMGDGEIHEPELLQVADWNLLGLQYEWQARECVGESGEEGHHVWRILVTVLIWNAG
jgi:hypothetical protein